MANPVENAQRLADSGPANSSIVPPDEVLRTKAAQFEQRIRGRDRREAIAALFLAAVFALFAFGREAPLSRAGCIVVAAAGLLIATVSGLKAGRTPRLPLGADPSMLREALLNAYDSEIRFLKTVKYWYIAPLFVGLALAEAGRILERVQTDILAWYDFVLPALFVLFLAGVWWGNEVVATRRLKRERADVAAMDLTRGA